MMRLDRAVALVFLAFSVVYGVLAWRYPLLPFEARVLFKPNTFPLGLAAVAILLSFVAAIWPGGEDGLSEDAAGWRDFDWRAVGGLAALMLAYAATIRPLGYIPSTTVFLAGGAAILGERRFLISIPVGLGTAVFTWYLVQKGLGIYLRPFLFSD